MLQPGLRQPWSRASSARRRAAGLGAVAAPDIQREAITPADEADLGAAGQGEDLAGGQQGPIAGLGGRRAWCPGQGLFFGQDAQVRGGAVPGAGCAGVQRGLTGGGQAVHPPLRRGAGVPGPGRAARTRRPRCG